MPKRRRDRGSFVFKRLPGRDSWIPAAGFLIVDLSLLSELQQVPEGGSSTED